MKIHKNVSDLCANFLVYKMPPQSAQEKNQ